MLDQSERDAIEMSLRGYLNQATTENSDHNQRLAREVIVRYGSKVLLEGLLLALILVDLQQARGDMLALTWALNTALVRVGYVLDFVRLELPRFSGQVEAWRIYKLGMGAFELEWREVAQS